MSPSHRIKRSLILPGIAFPLLWLVSTPAEAQSGPTTSLNPLPASNQKPRSGSTLSASKPYAQADRDASSRREAEGRRAVGIVLNALRSNPSVAPYPITISWQGNKVVVTGKVGNRAIYDIVVRILIDCGLPFREALIVDTGETSRAAEADALNITNVRVAPGQELSLGMEPPAGSLPPPTQSRAIARNTPVPSFPPTAPPRANGPVQGKAQVTVDVSGRVFLRGEVANEQVKAMVEQEAASVPGVTQVINELTVEQTSTQPDEPPPPPRPRPPADAVKFDEKGEAMLNAESKSLKDRVLDSIGRLPFRTEKPIVVKTAERTVTLGGKVASAYEAMLIFRSAQQTPGVDEVVDYLEFPISEDESRSPLLEKGQPEDIRPYLMNHIQKNLGNMAKVDRLDLQGDLVEIHGTLTRGEDQKRIAAILRSIPILRGFQLRPTFNAN